MYWLDFIDVHSVVFWLSVIGLTTVFCLFINFLEWLSDKIF